MQNIIPLVCSHAEREDGAAYCQLPPLRVSSSAPPVPNPQSPLTCSICSDSDTRHQHLLIYASVTLQIDSDGTSLWRCRQWPKLRAKTPPHRSKIRLLRSWWCQRRLDVFPSFQAGLRMLGQRSSDQSFGSSLCNDRTSCYLLLTTRCDAGVAIGCGIHPRPGTIFSSSKAQLIKVSHLVHLYAHFVICLGLSVLHVRISNSLTLY